MDGEDGYFDERVAATYDAGTDEREIAETVDLLAGLGGSALEFAIGTGRVALPLAGHGVRVAGIDMSRAMVARLRAKPGGDKIDVAIGDFSTTRVDGEFDLVYLVFNTIMNLTDQQAQVACFRNAAAHLRPGGRFLIETMQPDLRRLPPGQNLVPFQDGPEVWAFDRYDVATQQMSSNYLSREAFRSIPFRYVWPSELDLMAQMAGLTPEDRWESWSREPFTHESTRHVSTWRRPA
ncbi:class I SAM-dependent methyltransferase [Actinoplanes sp. NPDC051343]|jgi:SAM-dependent methyltransferase|uniref:class I SAM-dependent methyltransferase n=1 Tax=Actinoplanes sp. NPDC051343 TaxID=3363906 RepID=UPI00379C0EB9